MAKRIEYRSMDVKQVRVAHVLAQFPEEKGRDGPRYIDSFLALLSHSRHGGPCPGARGCSTPEGSSTSSRALLVTSGGWIARAPVTRTSNCSAALICGSCRGSGVVADGVRARELRARSEARVCEVRWARQRRPRTAASAGAERGSGCRLSTQSNSSSDRERGTRCKQSAWPFGSGCMSTTGLHAPAACRRAPRRLSRHRLAPTGKVAAATLAPAAAT